MNFTEHLYNISLIAFLMAFVDFFYLYTMGPFFNTLLNKIQGHPIKLDFFATLIVYLFLVFQLYYFVLINADKPRTRLLLNSFLLGLSTYAVFEFTNKAIFTKWSYEATLYDSIWGGVLFSITTFFYLLYKTPAN